MGHSKKYEKVLEYYFGGYWKLFQVKNAVKKNWITAEEFEEITGQPYEE